MRTLNLGILAHVDAGKTSLTERLLYAAGVIDEIGSVDDGSTQTDSLALERRRGITIKFAVVSFPIDDVTVNLIDTPGHPDFIAEVERVIGVLDGAVLVISGVEGVQAQTRLLMRTLRRLQIPTLIFVNKIDRSGARYGGVLREIADKLTPAVIAMGSVVGLGTRSAEATRYGAADVAFTTRLVDIVTRCSDAMLAAYVDGDTGPSYQDLCAELAIQTKQAAVHPVFFGSAITGTGVAELAAAIIELLPVTSGLLDGPPSGAVFKVERGDAGERIAYVRMQSGTVRVRDRLKLGARPADKVTAIEVFKTGSTRQSATVAAGEIGKLWGLEEVRIGDTFGRSLPDRPEQYFAPPTLESVVSPVDPADRGALYVALAQLAEQDPLINLRHDDVRHEVAVSLYGEVQKEVIQETLATDFDIRVEFRETTTICIERPTGTGAAVETIAVAPNPFLATVGLRIDPAPAGCGIEFRIEIEPGSLPVSFRKAIEDAVHDCLSEGLLGWQVTDCTVTLTQSGYWARQSHAHGTFDKSMSSTAGDFRNLTPLVLMSALQIAGTEVLEPVNRFRLEVPLDVIGQVLPLLARRYGVPQEPVLLGSSYVVEGEIPAARVHELQQRLPGASRGEGVLESSFDSYQPVRGPVPRRPRSDHHPLDRRAYLRQVQGYA